MRNAHIITVDGNKTASASHILSLYLRGCSLCLLAELDLATRLMETSLHVLLTQRPSIFENDPLFILAAFIVGSGTVAARYLEEHCWGNCQRFTMHFPNMLF